MEIKSYISSYLRIRNRINDYEVQYVWQVLLAETVVIRTIVKDRVGVAQYSLSEALMNSSLDAIQKNPRTFTLVNIDKCKFRGIYAIWWQRRCLYVGESRDQTVYHRLYRHWSKCHNERLRLWIEVKRENLNFTTFVVTERDFIFILQLEKFLIHSLQPETNIRHS